MNTTNDYFKYLLDLNTQELLKECVENREAIVNLQSVIDIYENALLELNCKIESTEIPSGLLNDEIIYTKTVTFPMFTIGYKSQKNHIISIIRKALAFGGCKKYIDNNTAMMNGKRVIILE